MLKLTLEDDDEFVNIQNLIRHTKPKPKGETESEYESDEPVERVPDVDPDVVIPKVQIEPFPESSTDEEGDQG